ncbi:MAG: sirohydrochlorin cobaltochelatase [Eubacteriales bacterium]
MRDKTAILVVSFGTTYVETRAKNITAVLDAVKSAHPDYPVYEAWTSSMIMRSLEKKGQHVDNVTEALEQIHKDGITDLYVLPTHLLYGEEYDKMNGMLDAQREKFASITVAQPLLADTDALETVLRAVAEGLPCEDDEALVLMGHGTPHFCNTVYAALDYQAKDLGLCHVFVGTVEAYPDLDTVLNMVQETGYTKIALTPLMLVAGDHATNDMASSEEDSWNTIFKQNGYKTRCIIRGLGEYPRIVEEYLNRLNAIM